MRIILTLLVSLAIVGRCRAGEFEELYNVETSYVEDNLSKRFNTAVAADFDFNLAHRYNLSQIPEVPITWIGAVELGGPNISITGTHHFVKHKLHELGAYWLQNKTKPLEHAIKPAELQHLEKRYYRSSYACNQPIYEKGSCGAIMDEDYYVPQHYANGVCITGPNSCGRFACEYNTAVLMCTPGAQVAIPCAWLGYNVNFIMQTCVDIAAAGWNQWCKAEGQSFYQDPSYNVLIKGTDPGRSC